MPERRTALWRDVAPWSIVVGPDGSTWTVLPGYRRTVVRRWPEGGPTHVIEPPADSAVTVLVPTADEAVGLLRRHLGAELIATAWTVPASAVADRVSLMRHLDRGHRTPAGWPTHGYGRDFAGLLMYHERLHQSNAASPSPYLSVPHDHERS